MKRERHTHTKRNAKRERDGQREKDIDPFIHLYMQTYIEVVKGI